jgi:hypothetical protein
MTMLPPTIRIIHSERGPTELVGLVVKADPRRLEITSAWSCPKTPLRSDLVYEGAHAALLPAVGDPMGRLLLRGAHVPPAQ